MDGLYLVIEKVSFNEHVNVLEGEAELGEPVYRGDVCRLRSKGRRATWKRLGTCSGKGRNMFKPESEKKLDAYKNPQEV